MQMNLQYSLIKHIGDATGLNTIWLYDGIALPTVKPFVTVEQMPNSSFNLSKQRETIRTYFHFQIGLHANNASERAKLQDVINKTLCFDQIALYDAEGTPANIVGYFYASVTGVTPISPEDPSDKTNYHKVYFDVEIDVTTHKGD